MKNTIRLAACLLLLAPLSGLAQTARPHELSGSWGGGVTQIGDGGPSSYDMWVAIALDRRGRLVGEATYERECGGVWTQASRRGRVWRFEETITAGAHCAPYSDVEVTRRGETLHVRLTQIGAGGQIAEGTLQRSD